MSRPSNTSMVCLLSGLLLGVLTPHAFSHGLPGRELSSLPAREVTLTIPPSPAGGILIAEIEVPDIVILPVVENGQVFQKISLRGYGHTSEVGNPRMPARGFLIAVPEGAQLTVEVIDSEQDIRRDYMVYPVPEAIVEDGGTRTGERFCLEASAYSEDAYYPREVASIGFYGCLREVRVAQLKVFPIQYNPARGDLVIHKKIRLRLTVSNGNLTSGAPSFSQGSTKTAPFEGLYRELILNYEPGPTRHTDSRLYRGHPHPGAPHLGNQRCKISVEVDGIYEIARSDLVDAGVPVDAIDPKNLGLSNLGSEIPILVTGEDDGSFDEDDRLEFFGRANTSEYSRTNVYWLTWSGGSGTRMTDIHCSPGDTLAVPEHFIDSLHIEENRRYYSNVYQGEGKDHWFWEQLTAPCKRAYPVFLPRVSSGPGTVQVTVNLRGKTAVSHHIKVSINGIPLEDLYWQGMEELERTLTFAQGYLLSGGNSLEVECPGSGMDQVFFNWFEMKYVGEFKAHEDYIRFRSPGAGPYQFELTGFSGSSIEVFKISDPTGTARLVGHSVNPDAGGYRLIFEGDAGEQEYIALSADRRLKPAGIALDDPSDLRSTGNRADYIIIVYEDFIEEIEPLRSLREAEGLDVEIVGVTDIYDEFSFGLFDPGAIKTFLEYAYWEWHGPPPAYVLLVGDASYDYRGNLPESRINYVPTHLFITQSDHLEACSDDWFGCVAGDDRLPDMLVGRLSAETGDEVRAMVEKIVDYETSLSQGDWRERVLLIADDPDEGGNFEAYCDALADAYILPAGFEVAKTYVSQCGSGCRTQLIDAYNNGCAVSTFMGHGSLRLWTAEEIFEAGYVENLRNGDRLPLVIAFTCLNGFFHHATDQYCLAEAFTRAPEKGSIACWCHSGLDYAQCSALIGNYFYESTLIRGNYILGSASQIAKINYLATSPHFWDQAEMLVLFGDPALELGFPGRPDLLPGSIAFDPPTPVAGARDTVIADVYNAGRDAASDFTVRFSNGHPESSDASVIADVRVSELGAGEHLEVQAVWASVPEPATYEIFVEIDPEHGITESSEWNNLASDTLRVRFPGQVEDTIPPGIVVCVDSKIVGVEFHNLDYASPCPMVEATLTDNETGIDPEAIDLILNDTPVTDFTLNTHSTGSDTVRLTCSMDSLPDGTYELKLRVSDCGCDPNRAGAEVTFVIESDLRMSKVTAYPNPAVSRATFAYSLSRPADRVTIDIYSITGRSIGSLSSTACGRNLNTADWDCRDRDGRSVASGVYFYHVQASRRSESTGCEGKILVVR